MFKGLQVDITSAALSVYDEDGFLGIQPTPYSDDGQPAPFELHQSFGFLSRPDDPDSTGLGCQMFTFAQGDDTHAWLSHDPRYIPLVPQQKKGGSVQYCKTGAFSQLDGDDGSYTLYVPYSFSGTTPSKAMAIAIDVSTSGSESVSIVHGDGMGITMANGALTLIGPGRAGGIVLDSSGVNILGALNAAGSVSTGGPAALALATGPGVIAALQAIQTLLTAMSTQLSAPGPVAGAPGAYAAALAAIAAVTTPATLMTKSTMGV